MRTIRTLFRNLSLEKSFTREYRKTVPIVPIVPVAGAPAPLAPPKPDTRPLAPPSRAAGKVSKPASGTRLRSASRHAVSPAPAGSWPVGPTVRTLGRSGHSGQRRPTPGLPAPQRPGSGDNGPLRSRVPGFRPGAPLQTFEKSGLAGRVRRGVRMFLPDVGRVSGQSENPSLAGRFGERAQGPLHSVETA